ncbi:relaxase/mobilization nuclease domain-containing protein [Stappia stellulata]|uniref:relaxase/mobilization nuclease domain-containing protein n=1 Tax=Stappia stellulata TaxID=71235 RepID=UPI0021E5AD30|nr:relaxase/mobilization nuclease domain-containing protein [Stappia stellulata]
MGLSDRQALIVSHNDTAHPHVHVIVNRVCLETDRAAIMGKVETGLRGPAATKATKAEILAELRAERGA